MACVEVIMMLSCVLMILFIFYARGMRKEFKMELRQELEIFRSSTKARESEFKKCLSKWVIDNNIPENLNLRVKMSESRLGEHEKQIQKLQKILSPRKKR